MNRHKFFHTCVGWPGPVQALHDMIEDSIEITRRTFMKHVYHDELQLLEGKLGYASHNWNGLTMAGDWHVSYHRSKLNGQTVYYFVNASIEYVFVPEDFNWRTK